MWFQHRTWDKGCQAIVQISVRLLSESVLQANGTNHRTHLYKNNSNIVVGAVSRTVLPLHLRASSAAQLHSYLRSHMNATLIHSLPGTLNMPVLFCPKGYASNYVFLHSRKASGCIQPRKCRSLSHGGALRLLPTTKLTTPIYWHGSPADRHGALRAADVIYNTFGIFMPGHCRAF